MRASWMMALLVGCSGSSDKDTRATGTGDTGAPDDTGTTDTDTDTVPGEDRSASLSGTILSPGGPLADVDLRLCRGTNCRNEVTDAGGAYTYADVAVDWYSFEVVRPEGTAYATAFAPLEFRSGEARTLDVVLLAHDAPSPLGPTATEHETGDGLYLTLGEPDLTPPLLAPRATEVSGVFVPEGQRVPTDGVTGTVLGMWYVDPFDHTATGADIPVRIEDRWALADGTELEVYVGDYLSSAWLSAGTATASGGQLTGAALPVLSTVILVQP
jgi:hypothetical protein